ncbi:trypsin-1-like [Leptopilina boulardi]|uniref:trypsin-1-like n=1 Tax=Leptopilina boulardi TaxID=63433 RepID=UPI0021F516FC|nr:trypsin-1-like [Leptopilina boulardi]
MKNMFKFLLIIGLFGIFSTNARQIIYDYNERIVNGYNIDIKDAPYQIGIFNGYSFICGGTIISIKYIITAGHCLADIVNNNNLIIQAGSSELKIGGSFHIAINVIIHEMYNESTMEHDIALIEIYPLLSLDKFRQPIGLLKNSEILKIGDIALITGWGDTIENGELSLNLQAVRVPIISRELCQQQYNNNYEDIENIIFMSQICAGYPEGGKDSCHGDSGGPMVVHGQLTGIVSYGIGCARAALPGVYTHVAYYIDWIEKNTNLKF